MKGNRKKKRPADFLISCQKNTKICMQILLRKLIYRIPLLLRGQTTHYCHDINIMNNIFRMEPAIICISEYFLSKSHN